MKKKILVGIAVAIAMTVVLLSNLMLQTQTSYAAYVRSLPTLNSEASSSFPTVSIPGTIVSGDYITIGFNNAGSFGVGVNMSGTGFQYPKGSGFESLAWAYWGEGYVFAYETNETGKWVDHVAWFEPENNWPPPVADNVKCVSFTTVRNDADYATIKAVVKTYHGLSTGPYDLQVTFTCMYPKHSKYVILKTTVQNLVPVKDLIYKRFVDWDIHGDIVNKWTSDSNSAYADYYNKTMGVGYEFTVSAQSDPSGNKFIPYVDLYGWDDFAQRSPGVTVQTHSTSLLFDGAACITFDLGAGSIVAPKVIGDVYLYYEASENTALTS